MGDWVTTFGFPGIREEDAWAFRTFMTSELITREIIHPEECDCTLDPDYVDTQPHAPARGFRDTILEMKPNDRFWFDDCGLKYYKFPESENGYFPTQGIGLCVGRYVNFLAINNSRALHCPTCKERFESDAEGKDTQYSLILNDLFCFMGGDKINPINCPNCSSKISSDIWMDLYGNNITSACFFHVSVWRWSGNYEVKFKTLLEQISSERAVVNSGKL